MKFLNVKNPLSVIAIFASLTEVFCTSVTPFIEGDNQTLFLYFIIGFPTLLITLFFLTLNFNHKVLYAPSDFVDTDMSIASLFYGKIEAIKHVDSTKTLKPNSYSSFFEYYKSQKFGGDQPYLDYANSLFRKVISLLPEEKLDDIWCGKINNIVFYVVTEIKKKVLKEGEYPRTNFVIMLNNANLYKDDKDIKVEGLIAGSGIGNATFDQLGDYIVSIVKENIK